ncbi:MAG: NAD(P)/FAD-dependent oxidoreductase [Verrucomicrobiota bacterium]|nr:NAD(P)/FAD-dependent oxidoreductase [Verrucomicrobiota bacterium]
MKYDPEFETDVAVVGGGPAGTALATLLVQMGHKCCLFERDEFPRYHIGESLIPNTYSLFDKLGLLPALRQSDFPRKHSVRFVSPEGTESDPFYFSERIAGEPAVTWQVERGEFDRMMLDHARSNGVIIHKGSHVEKVLFKNGCANGVMFRQNGSGPLETKAKVVVDASGRATLLGNQLNLKRPVPSLKKSSIWGYYRHGARLPGIDAGETTIYRIHKDGWFWDIPLPDDIVSVGLVDETDALFEDMNDPEFSFGAFAKRYPEQKAELIDCLMGDVIKDMSQFRESLGRMTAPPPSLR